MTILSKLQEGVSVCTEWGTGKRERAEKHRGSEQWGGAGGGGPGKASSPPSASRAPLQAAMSSQIWAALSLEQGDTRC